MLVSLYNPVEMGFWKVIPIAICSSSHFLEGKMRKKSQSLEEHREVISVSSSFLTNLNGSKP